MQISAQELKLYLNSNVSKMVTQPHYEVETVSALSFLTPNRIDIFIKYLYAKCLLEGRHNSFLKELYINHIKAFNHFVEADDSNKIGKESFLNSFNELVESIRSKGVDKGTIIPVNDDFIPVDGAHRIAIAAALGMDVQIVRLTTKGSYVFDCIFFENRGLDRAFLDFVSIEYAKFKDSVRVILVWPQAIGHDEELQSILTKSGTIINEKKIKLNYNGVVNLQIVSYKNESWLGSFNNDFEGAHVKATQCYNEHGYLQVFLYEPTPDTDLITTKEEIRSVFGIGKHAVHINDTHLETIEIVSLLFDPKNVVRLNCAHRREMKVFNRLFPEFKKYLEQNYIPKSDVAIIGGVLATFGVKDVKDIDYISTADITSFISDEIELEKKKTEYSSHSVEELITDPRLYFIYDGIKFISIESLLEIKVNRNNDGDKMDALILRKIQNEGHVQISFWDNIKKVTSISYYRRTLKQFLLKIRYVLFQFIYKVKNGGNRKGAGDN